jgi:hypothetical protein
MGTLRAVSNGDDTSGQTNLSATDGTGAGMSELTVSGGYSSGLMNKNSVPEFTVVPTPLPPPPSHLLINLIPDASVANAPVGFWSAMTAAAQFFDNELEFARPLRARRLG